MIYEKHNAFTRRDWLKVAGGAVVAPYFVPSSVFGATAPSEQLNLGCIGTGRKGHTDMRQCLKQGLIANARVIAVCDVDLKRAQHAKQEVDAFYKKHLGKSLDCHIYGDYRELLNRGDIDGVTIVTPDHWHAINAIDAANAGKDMYLQKPLTYSIAEGRRLVNAVRSNQRVLQVGSQQRSSQTFQHACEVVRNGRIGKLHTIYVMLPPDKGVGDSTPTKVPKNLNYDLWLGPASKVPYAEHRVHPQDSLCSRPGWLQVEATCRGMITGWGVHMNDIAQWGNGSQDSGPVEFEAQGEFPDRGLYDVHTRFQATARYANGVNILMRTGSAGVKFEGDEGWVHVTRRKIEASEKSIVESAIPQFDPLESDKHMLEFLQCMRTRKDPIATVEIGHRSNSLCVATHIAMKLGRKLNWNPEVERFVGDDEANRMLDTPYRDPWTI